MKQQVKKFTDVWRLPFKKDTYGRPYVCDYNGQICFMLVEGGATLDRCIALLNGNTKEHFKAAGSDEFVSVFVGDNKRKESLRYLGCVYGYDWLTSRTGLRLDHDIAISVMEQLRDFCVKRLVGNI